MMRSMFAGVTGLRNHQTRMDAIGNNIANVNTVGYKGSRVSFQDTLNQTLRGASAPNGNRGGINPLQVGLGMNLASIDVLHTQGNLQNTGKVSDVAIQGDGFFVLSDGARQYYTRAGNFNLEQDGRLVNPSNGLLVQGWMADNLGAINTNSPLQAIQLPVGQTIAPIATTEIRFGGNVDKNLDGLLEYPALNVSDPAGHTCTVELELTPVGFNEFQYQARTSAGTLAGGTGTIILNNDGTVASAVPPTFSVTPPSGTAVTITLPTVGATNGGAMVTFKPVNEIHGFTTFNAGAALPQTSGNITLTDDAGTSFDVQIQISDPGATWPASGTYDWTLLPVGTTQITGATGTITWDAATQRFTASTINAPGTTTLQADVGSPRVTLANPEPGTSIPTLRVTSKEGAYNGAYTQAQSLVTITRVYDSLGTNHTLTTTITKVGVNNWDWVTTDEGGATVGSGHLAFNTTGELVSATGSNITFTPPGAQPVTIVPDFSGVTQYSGGLVDPHSENYDPTVSQTEVTSPFQNGYPMGQLQGYNIDKSGIIVGVFSNGMNQNLAQIALANFTNPGGLSRSGDSMFEETSNSGSAQIGVAGRAGRGQVTPGAIEMSNVDLSQEFTEMIMTERGFQSNSRVITTSDEMLQELVNLKR